MPSRGSYRFDQSSGSAIASAFYKYLQSSNHPDSCKRDELRAAYNLFVVQYRGVINKRQNGRFSSIVISLKRSHNLNELGDYYSFGSEVQNLFDNQKISEDMKETYLMWEEKAKENPTFCAICGISCSREKDLEQHKQGHRHRLHELHKIIHERRDQLVTCPVGVSVVSDPGVNQFGVIERECKPGGKVTMSLSLKNDRLWNGSLVLLRQMLLWDTGVFKLTTSDGRIVRPKHHIETGKPCSLRVNCVAPMDFGHHFVPIAFYFVWRPRGSALNAEVMEKQFTVLRFVSLHVLGDLHEELAPTAPFQMPEEIPDPEQQETIKGEPLPTLESDKLSGTPLSPSPVPKKLPHQVKLGLTGKQEIVSIQLRECLSGELTSTNYRKKFDTLLWIEEMQMAEDIKTYDLQNVTMKKDAFSGRLILNVPGLLERRPSVLRGDRVYIYVEKNRSQRYEGIVHKVELHDVHLGVSPKLKNKWIKGMLFDIRFDFSRATLWSQHRALSTVAGTEDIVFPHHSKFGDGSTHADLKPWFDRSLNPEQQTAVTNMVWGTSRPAPYLVFGPPGTGKTVTITEAIRQVYHCIPSSQILICCPENAAADLVMKKLTNQNIAGPVQKRDIYRLYALSRHPNTIPEELKGMCNLDTEVDEVFYPNKGELKNYRILVVTLMTSSRIVTASFPRNYFSHIFVDEGAHAVEPECLIPIAGLLDASTAKCGQLAIAGDPKQLGPILRSPFSLHYGLDISYMERIMTQMDEYKRQPESSSYNTKFITKLVRNYRSHEELLQVPRQLFYDNELVACGNQMILDCMLNWEHLPNKKFPIIFHSVFGQEEREAQSPSYFNRDEVSQVEKYLRMLLTEKKAGLKIQPKDIGIISPYRRQVMKLRRMIENSKNDYGRRNEITVGSVEEFQGQEFKVIIISTVRSDRDIVVLDNKERSEIRLGFLKNPKRFNVALTRARSLLIVVGNPLMLEQDDNWKKFLDFCDENGGYKGQRGKVRPSAADNKAESVSLADLLDRKLSLREQVEEPGWVMAEAV